MSRRFDPLWLALGFLTRLPVFSVEAADETIGRSVGWFTLVGVALGAVLATASVVLQLNFTLAPEVVAAALLGLHILLTGALHLDGVADLFDGLGAGHKDKSTTLAAMQDTQIGAFGVVGLVMLLLLKWTAMTSLLKGHSIIALLILFPAVARAAVVPLVVMLPAARPTGLGQLYHQHSSGRQWLQAWLTLAAIVLLLRPSLLLVVLAALAIGWLLGARLAKRIGGLTGDAYGFVIEWVELFFLLLAGHFA